MARRQADALRRVGRLRSALVLTLKRHFPEKFTLAESGLGGRLSDADDEILLAYLAAFLGANPLDNHLQTGHGLAELRQALYDLGFSLEGESPTGWAQQLRERKFSTPHPDASGPQIQPRMPSAPLPPAPLQPSTTQPATAPVHGGSPQHVEGGLGALFAGTQTGSPTPGLGELFGESPIPGGQAGEGPLTDPEERRKSSSSGSSAGRMPSLGDLFLNPPSLANQDGGGRWSPSPLITRATPSAPQTDRPEQQGTDEGAKAGRERAARDKAAPRDLFLNPERPLVGHDSPPEDDQEPYGWQDPTDELINEPADVDHFDVDDERLVTQPEDVGTPGREPVVVPTFQPAVPTPQTADASRPTDLLPPVERVATGPGYETQLRPELFIPPKAPKTTRRGSKTVRQRAERPDPLMFDIPLDAAPVAEVEPALRERLTSAALLPRPVFTSDLLAIAVTTDVVSAWEGDLRADPANSPVRFLAAKGRHRLRGSLVVPVNREPVDKGGRPNWWADCVERYRGSRLYELGVLLHRVGEEVISAEFDEHAALLRLNSARGIVGVLVVFDSVTEDANGIAFDRMLTQLLGERCSLIAVLTTAGEAAATTSLGETIGKMAVAKGWRPSVPVITARSWEFADDRGSTAQLILGG